MSGHHFGPTGTKGAKHLSTLPRAPGNQFSTSAESLTFTTIRQTLDGAVDEPAIESTGSKAPPRLSGGLVRVWGEEKADGSRPFYLGSPLMTGYWTQWTG